MNKLTKICTFSVIVALFLSGCITDEELVALVKAEQNKSVQERAERTKANEAALENSYKQRVEKYWIDLAEHNYNLIQARYAGCKDLHYRKTEDKVLNRYGSNGVETDCLNVWVEPRLALSQEEKMKGRALLEGFGSRYMPNAYASYDKAKESAEEIQQMFNEEFPKPWTIKPDDPKWQAYCKLLNGLCKARSKYFRAHDELAHFYIMHKVGAATGEDLAKLDQGKIVIRLLEENGNDIAFPIQKHEELDSKASDFGTKYAPEAYAIYTKLKRDRDELISLYDETLNEALLIDAVRFNLATIALCEKINYITLTMDKIGTNIRALYVDHKTMDKDAESVAKTDHAIAMRWKTFVAMLPKYVYDRANGPLIPVNSPMNAFYPNTEILRWHLYALGFPSERRGGMRDGFEKNFYFYGKICTGDEIDTLSMADYISNDYVQLVEAAHPRYWESVQKVGKGIGYTAMTEEKSLNKVSIAYQSFSARFLPKNPGMPYAQTDGMLMQRSSTKGVMYMSIDAVLTPYGKFAWNRWNGTGDTILIMTPFEARLNEFNWGKGYCRVVVTRGKERNEPWWKVVAR